VHTQWHVGSVQDVFIAESGNFSHHPPLPRGQCGFSLVELLVGLTIGLFVIAGALSMFVSNILNSRRTLVEARLHQDLQSATDLISRELRRAGYWGNAINGTIAVGTGTATVPNPYAAIAANSSSVSYSYSKTTDGKANENDTLDANEQFGFRLSADGVVQMQTAANTWQDLTDKNVIRVTAMSIDDSGSTAIPMGSICSTPLLPGTPNYPYIVLRQYALTITAQAATDANVTRWLRTRVKARNDIFVGACP
jgi:prepilin peptidase dependent protein B